MGCTVTSMVGDHAIGQVNGTGGAIVNKLPVADTKTERRLLVVHGPGIVLVVAGQDREAVARSRTLVVSRNGTTGLCVFVHHGET